MRHYSVVVRYSKSALILTCSLSVAILSTIAASDANAVGGHSLDLRSVALVLIDMLLGCDYHSSRRRKMTVI